MSDTNIPFGENIQSIEKNSFDREKASYQYSGLDKEKIIYSNFFEAQRTENNFLIRFFSRTFMPNREIDIKKNEKGEDILELGRNNCIDFKLQSSILLDQQSAVLLYNFLTSVLKSELKSLSDNTEA